MKNIGKNVHLRNLVNDNFHFEMLAIDQRPPIFNIIKNAKGGKASYKDIAEFKGLLTQFLSPYSSAILMDPIYSFPNLMPLNKSKGLVMTLEDHNFIDGTKGRLSKKIKNWSVEKIKKSGGDAVKVLLWYRPDASKLIINKQKKFLMEIGNDCKKFDIPLLLELLVYPFKKDDNYNTNYSSWQNKKHDQVINSIKEFSKLKYNVDIFKVESPVDASKITKANFSQNFKIFKQLNSATNNKPWVMLSSGMNKQKFIDCLKLAYKSGASGYLAGRSIWLSAFEQYPNLKEVKLGLKKSITYMKKLNKITKTSAKSMEDYLTKNFKLNNPKKFTDQFKKF